MDESPPIKTLEQVELEHIHMALTQLRGNMTATAEALGIDRRTLYRKTEKTPELREFRGGRANSRRTPKHVRYLERRVVELEQRLAKHEGIGPK